jgi:hypothetical protein
MIALKLEFGVFRNQVFERYLSVFPLKHAEELCHVCHCIRKDEILRYIEL